MNATVTSALTLTICDQIVALTSHMPPTFSIAGTLNIIFFGIFLGFAVRFLLTTIVYTFPKARKYFPGPIQRLLPASFCDRLIGIVGRLENPTVLVVLTAFPILPHGFGRREYLYSQIVSNVLDT